MRMPSGYGSVIKLKGNRRKPFQVRITKGWTELGKQKFEYLGYYEKREDALIALAEYNSNPYDIAQGKITFKEVYKNWSEGHFKKVGESSIENYTNAFNNYCKDLYDVRFKDLKLNNFQAIIDNSGKAYPTRKVIATLLNQMTEYAQKNDIVEKNYAQFIDIGQNEGNAKRNPFAKKEIETLFKYSDKLDYVDTILIMIYTGLRVGELLDIKTENVHLDERYMVGGLKTKAGKNRIIPINKKIKPFIEKYYNPENEYLITNFKGNKMQYSNYRREKFDNIMEQLKMKHVPHECRHTFASLMNSANANKLCIKRIMGHSSQDITDDVYTHKTIDELIAAIDLI